MSKKNDAQEIMDILSEKYKDYKNSFWDSSRLKIEIQSLNEASVYCFRHGSTYAGRTYSIQRKWIIKLFGISLKHLIDFKMKKIKNILAKENVDQKKLIDLQRLYNK